MLFNSIEFIVFFIVFMLLWGKLKQNNTSRWLLITSASLFFYAWWDWRFVFLIIFSGLVDYFAGIGIEKYQRLKNTLLITSLVMNLGVLFIFKYTAFLAQAIQDFFRLFSIQVDLLTPINEFSIILPLGVSFYTFQSMSYTIDVYRGRLKPTKNMLHFFSYLVMFPQLVAGPIVRAKDLLKQLESYKKVSSLAQWNGLKMIVYGFFRKVVIADNLAYLVDSAFENKSNFDGTLFWWVVSIAFSFQIYNDFSGYSLIARGIAKLMGYHFKMNFNHPYLSKSFRGFWQSWHISLSTWFRDYVYIPLGGSRKGNWKMVSALAITFLLSGLWHGANYTFIVWALLHILFLLTERFVKPLFKVKTPTIISILVVFVFVNIAWAVSYTHLTLPTTPYV